ncbi:IS1/IS1595 family N-terminal zinc-binding domain-containing protein [Arsenicibacter rosenii]|uniref:IS1/IS1595 family N-terminal zinc-binding domain-containing protein n=1 Tax=Arsenicibacter rosenii TaxID=1750698 RepID=UPI0009F32A30
MVLEAIPCKHCGKTDLVKRYGTTPAATQRFQCGDCKRTFVRIYTNKACDPLVSQQITDLVLNGGGVLDTARMHGINRNTVSRHFKIVVQRLRC